MRLMKLLHLLILLLVIWFFEVVGVGDKLIVGILTLPAGQTMSFNGLRLQENNHK